METSIYLFIYLFCHKINSNNDINVSVTFVSFLQTLYAREFVFRQEFLSQNIKYEHLVKLQDFRLNASFDIFNINFKSRILLGNSFNISYGKFVAI